MQHPEHNCPNNPCHCFEAGYNKGKKESASTLGKLSYISRLKKLGKKKYSEAMSTMASKRYSKPSNS